MVTTFLVKNYNFIMLMITKVVKSEKSPNLYKG